MFEHRMRFIILAAVTVLFRPVCVVSAETWHLEQGRDWKPLSAESQDDKYLLDVARIKQLVEAGQSDAVQQALNQLKEDFPEITGPDLDAFIEAEMLFCEGKYVKAVRSYDKFLAEYPESELYEAALDRQFAIATAFLAGRTKTVLGVFKMKGYAEGKKIMERISDRTGLDTPMGIKAAVTVAKSCEKRGRFNEAYYKWSEIFAQWKTGQIAKDALAGMARCKHAAYRGPKYDASALIGRPFSPESYYESAKGCYEEFKSRWPKDAEKIDADKMMKRIDEQLAQKQLSIGLYYQKTGNKQSANLYYQMVIDNWPQSTAAETAKEMLIKNLSSKETKTRSGGS